MQKRTRLIDAGSLVVRFVRIPVGAEDCEDLQIDILHALGGD
jgi:hypothetical protein